MMTLEERYDNVHCKNTDLHFSYLVVHLTESIHFWA